MTAPQPWTPPEGMVECEVGPVVKLVEPGRKWLGRLVGHVTAPAWQLNGRLVTTCIYRPCDADGEWVS